MKMFYGNTPVKSLNINHYERDTNDATLKPSDMQAGVTAYAKGKKVTGTGKCFEFATYGELKTNLNRYIPSNINIIEISSNAYPIRHILPLMDMHTIDFTTSQIVGVVSIDGVDYDLIVTVKNNMLKIACEKTFNLQIFYGKDNYTHD